MLRHILLSALAAATLAGCASSYSYRNGNGGDYYYGQPRVEYRHYDPYGYYGGYGYGYGGYAPRYYYDRYGRLVYGSPFGYYGYPYGAGGAWWHRPRPPHGGHDGHDGDHDDGDHDGGRSDRGPPWRNIGGLLPPGERTAPERDDTRPRMRRQHAPSVMPMPAPQRQQRPIAPSAPRMRSEDGGGSQMGRALRGARNPASSDD